MSLGTAPFESAPITSLRSMFSIVHVLLPFCDASPAEAIRASLARFERGRRGDVPDDWLAFHDETEHVRTLHRTPFVFSRDEGGGIRIEGSDTTFLDFGAIRAEMTARDTQRWAVRFADVEPDLSAFVGRFVRDLKRHPVTGGYGQWLNPIGRWDWWDLGGRFDGRIAGERRRPGRSVSVVSSGPSPGRSVLSGIADTLTEALGAEPPADIVVEADNNVEVVSRLIEDARAGCEHALPGAVLLPPGSVGDELRWVGSWPEIGPSESLRWLGLVEGTEWREVVLASYERFPDHWAAGVAYHL